MLDSIHNQLPVYKLSILMCCVMAISCKKHHELIPNHISDKSINSVKSEEKKIALNELKQVFWGDLHMHTSLSIDAYIGGTITSPDDAYRFAKGEEIDMFGTKVKIRQPLDFCAVTDHAEALGEMYTIQTKGEKGHKSIVARYLRKVHNDNQDLKIDSIRQQKIIKRILKRADGEIAHPRFFQGFETTKTAWDITLQAAENHYVPGEFTTLAGYEWTLGGAVTHLHRNVIFRDMMVPDYPLSSTELTEEEQLWNYLKEITDKGATVLAIPHNSNFSDGGVFTETKVDGSPYDSNYASLRQEFEPIAEVHQVKGNSEVDKTFWKNDEFAGFENFSAHGLKKNNYLRYVLEKGLEHEEHLGVNPFKYGLIGSTDTHNGTPGNTEEDDTFIGNGAALDFTAENRREMDWALDPTMKVSEVINPGGLVAVWAEANTRAHVYDALKRKETYATSGNRISLRFFGGIDIRVEYESIDLMLDDIYRNGIPMGGDLVLSKGEKPAFLVVAQKDPLCANLDRIQIIKGWYDKGELEEKIYDVALSDERILNEDGTVPDNGATVNMETGEWSKDKGDAEIMALWEDPDFNSELRCFYYVRVLEVPTASWRLWDQIRYNVKYPDNAELIIQERAWSSPLWYSPTK